MILQLKEFQRLDFKKKFLHFIELYNSYSKRNNLLESGWGKVNSIVNELNKVKYADEWYYKFTEILPEVILEVKNTPDNFEEFEYLDDDLINELKTLYTKSPETKMINHIFKLLMDIGAIEIYTDSKTVSEESYPIYLEYFKTIQHNCVQQ